MAKATINYVCQECGYDSPQWLGKCPECGSWNSFKELKIPSVTSRNKNTSLRSSTARDNTPKPLSSISFKETNRISTSYIEMDGVLGGGIVPGSVTLLAGDPGIGKSTLLLQLALSIAKDSKKPILYISGEESEEQIKLRASRIAPKSTSDNFLLLSLTDSDQIAQIILDTKPGLVILDSIQTMESENVAGLSGAIGQVRYAAQQFISVAKSNNIPFIIVGHVTKEGTVAGPMVLSHMVDCVLFLEGEKFTSTRILRSLKNRFGPVDEVGIFLMEGEGMVEVKHPEQLFLGNLDNDKAVPGSVMVVTLEGTRAFLVELQALVLPSKLAYPRRVVSGVDARRLELLLAVLQKHCRIPLDSYDVFLNVAGGLKLSDPGVDLGICLAVYSSFKNKALQKTVGIAEVGLLGELRKVPMLEKRTKEATKLGFKSVLSVAKFKTLGQVLAALD